MHLQNQTHLFDSNEMTHVGQFCKQEALLIVARAGASAFDSIQKEALEVPKLESSNNVFMRGSWVKKVFVDLRF